MPAIQTSANGQPAVTRRPGIDPAAAGRMIRERVQAVLDTEINPAVGQPRRFRVG